MKRLLKFWSLPHREKQLFFEAAMTLLLSNLSVRTIAFRNIESFLRARWKHSAVPRDYEDDIKLVHMSLTRAANILPWESLCLSRSISEYIMLRRRGIPAVLYAGVKFVEDSSLSAHAWVCTGRVATEGNVENSAFTVVVKIGQPMVADTTFVE
jgi:hypothetical protein